MKLGNTFCDNKHTLNKTDLVQTRATVGTTDEPDQMAQPGGK